MAEVQRREMVIAAQLELLVADGLEKERMMASLVISVQLGSDLAEYALSELELVLEFEIDGDQL